MFGRDSINRAIKKGDLDKFKEIVEKNPDVINETFHWKAKVWRGTILDIAAYYNQAAILEFLLTEKKMDANMPSFDGWGALHHAACTDAREAIKVLLDKGANPNLRDDEGRAPYDRGEDNSTRELILSASREQQRQKELARQESEKQLAEAAKQKAEARAKGAWTAVSSDEIMFERDLPGNQYRLTNFFNFAAKSWTLITKDLRDGHMSQETKTFTEANDNEMISQARAQLDIANGAVVPETKAPKPEPKEKSKQDFTKIINVKL